MRQCTAPPQGGLLTLSEHHTAVGLAAMRIGACDQGLTGRLHVPARLEDEGFQMAICDHIGQPIRAQQQMVSGLLSDAAQLRNGLSAPHTARDLMAQAMRTGLAWRE
jgi:hypothetical protein